MKKVLTIIFSLLLIVFLLAELFVMPVIDLTNKGDRKTLNIVYAEEILEVEHSISYIIPFGKDYYYLGIDDNYDAYIIHAPKKWDEKNFSETGDNSVEITALAKKISDYKISSEISSTIGTLDADFPLGASSCLELTYIRDAIMQIVSGILLLILTIIGCTEYKKRAELPPLATKIYAVAAFFTIILVLISIR